MQMPAIMALAADAARHAAARQAVSAENVVNADTPGFRPSDLTPFDPFAQVGSDSVTRPGHISFEGDQPWRSVVQDGPLDPNGNGVDMETEILRATEAQRRHDRALSVYSASLDILRTSLGRGR